MEHRQGLRNPVDIDAIAESPTCGRLSVRITDVSLNGVRLRGDVEQLPVYAPLRLTFRLYRQHPAKTYQWRGFVVRAGDGTIGAMFESPDPVDQSGLLALLAVAEEQRRTLLLQAS
ncbi:MAG: PilZ domain-containing protein [Gammaproteobacteria bacterium]